MVKVGLAPSLLDNEVGGGDSSSGLSAGQQQLLSFGRTLLKRPKVVVMDEPTSNIDFKTDEAMQRVVREEFRGKTVVTIAHRLNTIIDYDSILVMSEGVLVEQGPPSSLLANAGGYFCSMAHSLGERAAEELRLKAQKQTGE
jgi:ABC-type multidrug transport system fused ATPase/permease subunit